MGLAMTDYEIAADFRQAKNKERQIGILADLNACKKDRIINILHEKGVLKDMKVDVIKAKQLYDQGLTDNKIAEELGVSGEAIRQWRKGAGLKNNFLLQREAAKAIKVTEGITITETTAPSADQSVVVTDIPAKIKAPERGDVSAERFAEIVDEMLARCRGVLTAKAKEYATEDRLHNFRIAAKLQGITERQALAGMMSKHTVSVYDMCRSGDYPIELWDEKITDSINYLLLLRALVIEQSK